MARKKARVQVFPPVIMDCEFCGGPMVSAPRGSQNMACIQCGRVKYGTGYKWKEGIGE